MCRVCAATWRRPLRTSSHQAFPPPLQASGSPSHFDNNILPCALRYSHNIGLAVGSCSAAMQAGGPGEMQNKQARAYAHAPQSAMSVEASPSLQIIDGATRWALGHQNPRSGRTHSGSGFWEHCQSASATAGRERRRHFLQAQHCTKVNSSGTPSPSAACMGRWHACGVTARGCQGGSGGGEAGMGRNTDTHISGKTACMRAHKHTNGHMCMCMEVHAQEDKERERRGQGKGQTAGASLHPSAHVERHALCMHEGIP